MPAWRAHRTASAQDKHSVTVQVMNEQALDDLATATTIEQQTYAEQVRLLYHNAPAGISVNLVNAAIVAAILWGLLSSGMLLAWLGSVLLVALLRGLLLWKYRVADDGQRAAARWGLLFCVGSAAAGLTWGAIAFLTMLYLDLPYEVFVTFVAGGMMLGGMAVNGALLPAYLAFLLPAGLPVAFGFFVQAGSVYAAMGALSMVFIVAMHVLGRNINASIVRAIQLARELEAANRQLRTEVAERKRVEAALREEERRYALATSAGRVGIWDWNLETNELHLDPSLQALLGYADHGIRTHLDDWAKFVHPDDREPIRKKANDHLQGLTPQYELTHRMLHRDGRVRWFIARGSVLKDAGGKPCRIVGTATDITERRLAEEQARQHQAELAHVVRLSTLGEMSTTLAHELNQPLGAIANYSQACLRFLRGGTGRTAVLVDALEQITEQAQRASEIIRRIRAFVGKSDDRPTPIDCNALVMEAVQLIEMEARQQGVELQVALAEPVPRVFVDALQIQQVVLNIAHNAIEAMVGAVTKERRLIIRTELTSPGWLEVSLEDTGPGLAPALLKRIFEPFYTTKTYGMGMGLAISRSVIEAYGGRLWAESAGERGTTFRFTVPIASLYTG